MGLSTYTELQASVGDFLNRSDLTVVIPDFITLAEAEFNRSLRVREMSVRTRAPVETQYVKLPENYLALSNVELVTDTVTLLQYKDPQSLDSFRRTNKKGKPLYFSVLQNNLEFAPVPDSEYIVEIVYYQRIPALAQNVTNWLLQYHPDLYLMSTLAQSAPYLKEDERIAMWAGKALMIIEQIKKSDEQARFSGSTLSPSFTPY